MGKSATAASTHEVLAVEPVIRRVVAARAMNPADVDDLVQDCLERLLAAHSRLDAGAVLPYAIVTARNLVASHATKTARRAGTMPRVLDPRQPDLPEDVVLADESRGAMMMALSRLSDEERRDVMAYYGYDGPASPARGAPAGNSSAAVRSTRDGFAAGRPDPATSPERSRGALRVRMARTRAKLRLEYLLAFRQIELPTPACHRVLLAISGGDIRRQRELSAGEHLLDCATCAALSEPLDRRSIALTGIALPGGLLAWAVSKARAHPVHAAATAAAGSAAVAAAAVLAARLLASPAQPPPAHHPPPAPAKVISHLTIGGRPVPQASAAHSVRSLIGEQARATGITVQSLTSHNGFWVGTRSGRLWVQLSGPLRPLRIRPGDRVRLTGVVVANSSHPQRAGVSHGEGAGLLATQGAHLDVRTTKISVTSGH